jgi:hypothetical protein
MISVRIVNIFLDVRVRHDINRVFLKAELSRPNSVAKFVLSVCAIFYVVAKVKLKFNKVTSEAVVFNILSRT